MSLFLRLPSRVLLILAIIFPLSLEAQSKESLSSIPAPTLNEQQEAGKGLFLQNCGLCHFPMRGNPKDPKSRTDGKTIGPRLNSLLSGAKPMPEATVRAIIQKGKEGKMPGFQYALEPKEIDAIIAFMKTL
jgi:mono/diheme cytochrome c family protein